MQKLLSLFEQGTIDEMGLGTIRDAFSHQLFPGITSIQTHLRYVLFVPWLYKILDSQSSTKESLQERLHKAEVDLITPLANTGDIGVIGIKARHNLKRPPSSIYWNCLRLWGILQYRRKSQDSFHSQSPNAEDRRAARRSEHDDTNHQESFWHPKLPKMPKDFPKIATFALSGEEALFIRDQINIECSHSLLALLANNPESQLPERFWEISTNEINNSSVKTAVALAQRFSLFVESMPLVYNLTLAEQQLKLMEDSEEADARVERYQDYLVDWVNKENAAQQPFDPIELWTFLEDVQCNYTHSTKKFIMDWVERVADVGISKVSTDETLRALVRDRELKLKGPKRARLTNSDRIRDWHGDSGIGALEFNWFRARTILLELYEGLGKC